MVSDLECRADTDSLIHRVADVPADAKRSDHVEIDLLRDRKRKYDVVPLLSVRLVSLGQRRRRESQ